MKTLICLCFAGKVIKCSKEETGLRQAAQKVLAWVFRRWCSCNGRGEPRRGKEARGEKARARMAFGEVLGEALLASHQECSLGEMASGLGLSWEVTRQWGGGAGTPVLPFPSSLSAAPAELGSLSAAVPTPVFRSQDHSAGPQSLWGRLNLPAAGLEIKDHAPSLHHSARRWLIEGTVQRQTLPMHLDGQLGTTSWSEASSTVQISEGSKIP